MPIGFFTPMSVPNAPLEIVFLNSAVNATGLTAYTYSSLGIIQGDYALVGIASRGASSRTLSGVTVNGVAGVIVHQRTSSISSGYNVTAFALVKISNQTVSTVVVTFSGAMGHCGVAVWGLSNLQSETLVSEAYGNVSATSSSQTLTMKQDGGIFVIAYYATGSAGRMSAASRISDADGSITISSLRSGTTLAWTNANPDAEIQIGTSSASAMITTSLIYLR